MQYVIGVVGLLLFGLLAWLPSSDRGAVVHKAKWIALLTAVEFGLGLLLLKTGVGESIVKGIRDGFQHLLDYAGEGTAFVFGDLPKVGADEATGKPGPFLLNVLMPIVFISALIGILQYIRVLPLIIKYLGLALSKINGLGKLESYNSVASALLGQSEVFISVKKLLPVIPRHRMYTLAASAMSTVSASILGAYMTLMDAKFVITAILLNMFGAFIVVSLINPYDVTAEEDEKVVADAAALERGEHMDTDDEAITDAEADVAPTRKSLVAKTFGNRKAAVENIAAPGTGTKPKQSFFEMLGEYILDGFKVAFTVAAMLIGFIALIAMLNGIFSGLFNGTTFQDVMGHVFSPLAYMTGIPWDEATEAGKLMGTKLVSNEFVAMIDLNKSGTELSEHSRAIVSTYLVSFANFSSIGIIAGAVKSLNEKQGANVAKFGLKLLYGATLVSFISATIVGLIY